MSFFGSIGRAFAGAFGFGAAAPPAPDTRPNGSDGVASYGGFLASGERDPKLQGERKWIEYTNAMNVAIIATGVRYRGDLLSGTKWHCEPNERGGKDAERGVEIVTQGLLTAQLPRPWPAVVRKASMYKLLGFSLHEWSVKQRSDGMTVFADISHRPQYTVDRWNKPDEQQPWDAIGQQSHQGNRYVIPRGRLFYCFDDTLTDSPDGVGLMRHVIKLVERLNFLEGLEGVAYETDLRGMPMGRAPLADLRAEAGTDDTIRQRAFVDDKTRAIRTALTEIFKSPDKLPYLLLDSSVYQGADKNTISVVQKWAFELLKGTTNGLPDVNVVIRRLQLEIARVLGIEFAMIGDGDSGSHSMHSNKTDVFATSLRTTLTEIASFATNDLARPLIGLNGLDPETCTPTLVAEPISRDNVDAVCRNLQLLAQAALDPDDEAIPVIREWMSLPPPPERTPAQLGMLGAARRGPKASPAPATTGAKPSAPSAVVDLGANQAAKR